jgi:hypothetical protein
MPAVHRHAHTVRLLARFCALAKAAAARRSARTGRCGIGNFVALAATAFITIASGSTAFAQAPAIIGVSPDLGGQYAQVTVYGNNFAGVTAVNFGSVPATSAVVTTGFPFDTIAATVPAGSGTVNVTATNSFGTSAATVLDLFTYIPPTVTSISPSSGPGAGGTSVTITGTNFSGGNITVSAVRFGSVQASSYVVTSPNSITAIAPPNTGTSTIVDVTVSTNNGTSATSSADQFTYSGTVSTVTGASPNNGPTAGGTTVTITGSNFTGATAVNFGGTSAPTFTVSQGPVPAAGTVITATSPPGTGTVDITVVTAGGTSATSAADQFTYNNGPTVTAVSPNSGPITGNTSVMITGTNFTGATAVDFGHTAAVSFTVNGPTSITATSPAGTGTVNITVTTAIGTSATNATDQFSYGGSPAVISISPNAGPPAGGTSVTVTGVNFTGATAVSFGATAAAAFTVNSATSITATSPAGTGTVDVTVATPGGTSATSSADRFLYTTTPLPTVTGLSPNNGPSGGGTSVTITGTNFTGATAVNFGASAATFTLNGPTSITATSPPGSGSVNVTVTTPGGTSVAGGATLFAYATSGPAVTAVSPNTGPPGGGTSVTITGTNFTGATAVSFGSTPATSFTVNGATSITATSPAGTGTVDVTVTTPGSTSGTSSADQFFYSKTKTSLSLTASPNPSTTGQLVTFTAKVTGSSPSGVVAFFDGATQIGTGTLSAGMATFATASLSAGSHSITASYAGDSNNAPASVSLIQIVSLPSDSIKLREMQVSTMPIVAQISGQAITGAIDSAIGIGFGGNAPTLIPNGSGFTYYFGGDPQATRSVAADQNTHSSSIDDDFAALGYARGSAPSTSTAPPPFQPPLLTKPIPPPRDWLAWVDVRGTDFDSTAIGNDLKGLQANATAGLTHILTSNIVVGLLAGYEHFDFSSQAYNGTLTGNGVTAGTYAGWRLGPALRFDAAVAWSDILVADTSGTASGNFTAYRWLASTGITGSYGLGAWTVEPSARVYALWEQESAYTDSLGTVQASRDFDTGRSSGGVKASYRFTAGSASLTPYLGIYGDYYFSKDSATTDGLTTVPILQGWAARTTAGLITTFSNGSQLAIGGEFSGVGSAAEFWTLSLRGRVAF